MAGSIFQVLDVYTEREEEGGLGSVAMWHE